MKIVRKKICSGGLMSAIHRIVYFPMLLLIVGLLATIVSCSGSKEEIKRDEAEPETNVEDPCRQIPDVVEYFDSIGFDRNLSVSLKCKQPEVTVKFPLPISIYNIPKRVDKWFYMVGKYEGTAKPEIENEGKRTLVGEVISLVVGVCDVIKEKVIYESVENYNATIYYKEGNGIVTRVVFTLKPVKETRPEE